MYRLGHSSMLPIGFHLVRRSSGIVGDSFAYFSWLSLFDKIKYESGGVINKGVLGTLCTLN